jgi:hypothetical protein
LFFLSILLCETRTPNALIQSKTLFSFCFRKKLSKMLSVFFVVHHVYKPTESSLVCWFFQLISFRQWYSVHQQNLWMSCFCEKSCPEGKFRLFAFLEVTKRWSVTFCTLRSGNTTIQIGFNDVILTKSELRKIEKK